MMKKLNADSHLFPRQKANMYLSALHSWVRIFKIIVMQIFAYAF